MAVSHALCSGPKCVPKSTQLTNCKRREEQECPDPESMILKSHRTLLTKHQWHRGKKNITDVHVPHSRTVALMITASREKNLESSVSLREKWPDDRVTPRNSYRYVTEAGGGEGCGYCCNRSRAVVGSQSLASPDPGAWMSNLPRPCITGHMRYTGRRLYLVGWLQTLETSVGVTWQVHVYIYIYIYLRAGLTRRTID